MLLIFFFPNVNDILYFVQMSVQTKYFSLYLFIKCGNFLKIKTMIEVINIENRYVYKSKSRII